MARKTKDKQIETDKALEQPEGENTFFLEEIITYEQWDDIVLRKAEVISILLHKNEIIISVNGNGERIQYNPEIHSHLTPGDILNVP